MTQTDKAPAGDRERVARIIVEAVSDGAADDLIHAPYQKSWDEPCQRRWEQFTETADAILAALREGDKDFVRVPRERYDLVRSLAQRGADKAGCDGWRAQEMCRQVANLLPAPSNK